MKIFALGLISAVLANANDQCENSPYAENKPGFCTDVTHHVTRTNSWVCRNCFNLRVEFNLGWLGPVGRWFDHRDFVWLAFKQRVSVIKWAGPADILEPDGKDSDGNYIYKLGFNPNFNPGDRRVDINIEFNDNDTPGDLVWAKLCPCGEGGDGEIDGCDASAIGNNGVGGFWHCGYWHRAGPEELRMAKCYYMCYGNPDDKSDESGNWFTAAKGRCFREQGKLHRPAARNLNEPRNSPRKFREMYKWDLGKNSKDKMDCTKGKGLKAKKRGYEPKTGGNKGGGKKDY